MMYMKDISLFLCDHKKQSCESARIVIEHYGKVHNPTLTGKCRPDDLEELGTFNVSATDYQHYIAPGLHNNFTIHERCKRDCGSSFCNDVLAFEQQEDCISNLLFGCKDNTINILLQEG